MLTIRDKLISLEGKKIIIEPENGIGYRISMIKDTSNIYSYSVITVGHDCFEADVFGRDHVGNAEAYPFKKIRKETYSMNSVFLIEE